MSTTRSARGAGLPALALVAAGLVACTSEPDEDEPAPLTGDLVVEDPAGDVAGGPRGAPAPPDGIADITRFVLDQRGGTVVIAVQLERLPEPDDDLAQSLDLVGDDPDRPRAVIFSTNRSRLKPVRASVAVRDDVQETIVYPCDGGVQATWSTQRRVVALEVPRTCLPRGGLELRDPVVSFGAKEVDLEGFSGADSVDLPDRLVIPPS